MWCVMPLTKSSLFYYVFVVIEERSAFDSEDVATLK